MGNKYLKLIEYMIFGIVGLVISTLLFHLRFNNPILRQELILFMEKGNEGYFLTFFYFEVLILIIGLGIYWIIKKKK